MGTVDIQSMWKKQSEQNSVNTVVILHISAWHLGFLILPRLLLLLCLIVNGLATKKSCMALCGCGMLPYVPWKPTKGSRGYMLQPFHNVWPCIHIYIYTIYNYVSIYYLSLVYKCGTHIHSVTGGFSGQTGVKRNKTLWQEAWTMDNIITYDVIPEFQGVFLPPLSGKLLFQQAPW